MLNFVLFVNKQGQTRFSQYYNNTNLSDRVGTEAEIIRKCLARNPAECSFFEYQEHKVVYRRYASLYFIVGIDDMENELAVLEFIHVLVETIDKYFRSVCELDIMFNVDKVHLILDEMVSNRDISETIQDRIMGPLLVIDRVSEGLPLK